MLAGATATGKSAVAQWLAERMGYAVLSADSMLVYRGMDVGTAKPSIAERGSVVYHGVDLVTPDQPFSTGRWLEAARGAVQSAGDAPLLVVGGTGLYIKTLIEGLEGSGANPATRALWQARFEHGGIEELRRALAARVPKGFAALPDMDNPRRLIRAIEHLEAHGTLPCNWRTTSGARSAPVPVLRLPRAQLHGRIMRRIEEMFQRGLLEETQQLRRKWPVWSATAQKAIGYAEATAVLDGQITEAQAVQRMAARTRQLAKRQETWFRHQTQTVWIDITESDTPAQIAQKVCEAWRQHGAVKIQLPQTAES